MIRVEGLAGCAAFAANPSENCYRSCRFSVHPENSGPSRSKTPARAIDIVIGAMRKHLGNINEVNMHFNSPLLYPARVAGEEIDFLEQEIRFLKQKIGFLKQEIEFLERNSILLENMPHIKALLSRAIVRFMFHHMQNFCWTIERALPRGSRKIHQIPREDSVTAELFRPLLPPTCALAECKQMPKVWIDVTNTYRSGDARGIARVARELAAAAMRTGMALPVIIEDGKLYPYYKPVGPCEALVLCEDVTYVVIDTFWEPFEEYIVIFNKAKDVGAKTVTCFHDIAALYLPLFYAKSYISLFSRAFVEMVNHSDACISVSACSLKKVKEYIAAYDLRSENPPMVGWFHLGASALTIEDTFIRDEITRLFCDNKVFLSVGTVEPNKGYPITLDAFELIWSKGLQCHFAIFGQKGWMSRALQTRILTHAEYNNRMHWFTDANDGELAFAYRNSYCVIQGSISEGFGLPIIEASLAGAPIIAADIDVFHEIAADEPVYFRSCDSKDLAKKLEASLLERPKVARVHYLSWNESLARMIEVVYGFRRADLVAR
ncbi:MAG: glycosyltransferase family 4 protein [Pseudomonadota bacterium]|nr:glycosyltransferase family 4 protein [Pseudomonadota bacterium]